MKSKELSNACKTLDLEFSILASHEAKHYIASVRNKFNPQQVIGHLAINDEDSVSLKTDEHEFTMSDKFNESPIRLFFDQQSNEKNVVFELTNGRKLSEVLGECYGMEYFISDPELSFLVSVNWYSIEIVGEITSRYLMD